MKSPSLPANVKALLRSGYNRGVELNSSVFAQEIRKPCDPAKDAAAGLHHGALKSMPSFELSNRLLGVLEELETMHGMMKYSALLRTTRRLTLL
jgi:hypothetical protein